MKRPGLWRRCSVIKPNGLPCRAFANASGMCPNCDGKAVAGRATDGWTHRRHKHRPGFKTKEASGG